MARVTVEDCLNNVDSRFTLVHLAVRRVLQLRHDSLPTLENEKGNKEVVLALREIAAASITPDNIRFFDESRPAPVAEPPLPIVEAERTELQEILEEVSSFGAPVEYDPTDQFLVEDQPQETPSEEEE
ncbi:MAG: DNA-directed RNA polymerase subunit omega [Syntrophobacteraceae bacterium]|nr:DNA-directed RNA polymerase subunit omega [Syntrophobacteraceae bacterium]